MWLGRMKRHHYPERGWIQFLIMRVLYEKPMHGYQLMEELEDRGFVLPNRLESGAIYTILRRMEAHGLLKSEWERGESGRNRRIYNVTDKGIQALRMGLKTIVKRRSLMENLIAFYRKQFERREEIN
jgi:DNA-binding PadR family transcriptional regulator